jgi:hypothetical protein
VGTNQLSKHRASLRARFTEALELHEDGCEPVDDDELRDMGLDPQESGDEDLPDFMHQS